MCTHDLPQRRRLNEGAWNFFARVFPSYFPFYWVAGIPHGLKHLAWITGSVGNITYTRLSLKTASIIDVDDLAVDRKTGRLTSFLGSDNVYRQYRKSKGNPIITYPDHIGALKAITTKLSPCVAA